MKLATIATIVIALLVAGGLVYWVLRAPRGSQGAGALPSVPPTVDPEVQPIVDRWFQMKSNCWEVNRWIREDAAALIQQLANGALSEQEFSRRFVQSATDLDKKCPAGAYIENPEGERMTIVEFARDGAPV